MLAIAFFQDARAPCGLDIKTELWLSLCRTYEIGHQLCIDRTNKQCFSVAEDADHTAETFANWPELHAAYPDAKYVMIERQAPDPIVPTMLQDYTHPEETGDLIYVVGPDNGGLQGLDAPGADWVQIPVADSRWGMWAIMAATEVMGDRWRRGNNG